MGDDVKALYKRMLEAINAKDLAGFEALLAKDAVNHTPMPGEPPGIEGARYRMGMLREAFPDFQFVTESVVADGDRVASRGLLTGTNTGSFMGMRATGKAVRVGYLDILRFADGKMVEHWAHMDQMGLMQQLGLAPAK